MGKKKDFLAGREWGRCFLALCLAGCLFVLGGCGRKGAAADEGTQEAQRKADTETEAEVEGGAGWETEGNSLAEWKRSLPEGRTEEMSAPAIRGICVTLEGEPYFAVSYEPREYKNSFDCWAISVPYQSMVYVDTEVMYDYFEKLANLELKDGEGADRAKAGIGDGNREIFAAYYQGQTDAGGQAGPDKGLTYRFGKEDGEGNYYVEAAGEIRKVEKAAADALFSLNPYDFVLKVVSVISVETVSKVEIKAGEKEFVMEAGEGEFTFDGRTVTDSEFYELYTELMSVFIEKELLEEERGKDRGDAILTLTYHRNREEAPKIVQEYYAYDEDYALARVNGTEFFLVSRDAVMELEGKIEDAF